MVWMFGRWVGKNDGDSGWGFGGLHGWFLTDLLSRAARGWMRVLVWRVFSGGVLGPGPYAGAGGGLGLARRGCACAGAACSAIWELQRYTALHDWPTTVNNRQTSPLPLQTNAQQSHTTYYTQPYTDQHQGTRNTWAWHSHTHHPLWVGGCESVMCVYSGSYLPSGVGMWVALSVLYISSVRDTRRDPHLITTLR